MARVLIVAKTRMGYSTCVGGLNLETKQNIRLLRSDGSNQPNTTRFEVGQVWELAFQPLSDTTPPHVEDVRIMRETFIGTASNLRNMLIQRVEPWQGDPDQLFEGKLTIEKTGYISMTRGLPSCSTGYWLPNNPLSLNVNFREGQLYYQIVTQPEEIFPAVRRLFIKYVGFAEPIDLIPSGTLVRVSLARWWQRPGTEEERCYLQLSGWYL